MSYDPTDPGPGLDAYDPDWKTRFHAAETMLAAVRACGEPVRDHDLCAQLTQELIDAHEAQYRYAWQLDAALRERYGLLPRSVDPTLHIPSPPHTANPAQMRAAEIITSAEEIAVRAPWLWLEGLFIIESALAGPRWFETAFEVNVIPLDNML